MLNARGAASMICAVGPPPDLRGCMGSHYIRSGAVLPRSRGGWWNYQQSQLTEWPGKEFFQASRAAKRSEVVDLRHVWGAGGATVWRVLEFSTPSKWRSLTFHSIPVSPIRALINRKTLSHPGFHKPALPAPASSLIAIPDRSPATAAEAIQSPFRACRRGKSGWNNWSPANR
jgi:hypothetical protein